MPSHWHSFLTGPSNDRQFLFASYQDGSYLCGQLIILLDPKIILLARTIRLPKWICIFVDLHVHACHVKERWYITWRSAGTIVETDLSGRSEETSNIKVRLVANLIHFLIYYLLHTCLCKLNISRSYSSVNKSTCLLIVPSKRTNVVIYGEWRPLVKQSQMSLHFETDNIMLLPKKSLFTHTFYLILYSSNKTKPI